MCGLVGFISNSTDIQYQRLIKTWFTHALMANTLRGDDATGVYIATKKHWSIYKEAMPGGYFITQPPYSRLLSNSTNIEVALGHNRLATKGSKLKYAAHPFSESHIALAHNGTVFRYNLDDKESPNDSHAILQTMVKKGEKETLELLDGAYALTWHNRQTNTFNIARNKERPLIFSFSEKYSTMFYASEAWLIDALGGRLNISFANNENFYPEPGSWLQWDLTQNSLKDYVAHEFKLFTPKQKNKSVVIHSYHENNNHDKWNKRNKNLVDTQGRYITLFKQANNKEYKRYFTNNELKLCKYLDIEPGEEIFFKIDKIEAYTKKKSHGTVIGKSLDEDPRKDYSIAWYNVDIKQNLSLKEGNLYCGIVEGVFAYLETIRFNVTRVTPCHSNTSKKRAALWINKRKNSFVQELMREEQKKEEAQEEQQFYGPLGQIIGKDAWDILTEGGCSICHLEIKDDDAENIDWTQNGEPICEFCLEKITI